MKTTIPVVWMDGTLTNSAADFAFALNASCGAGTAEALDLDAERRETAAMCDSLAAAEDFIQDRHGNFWQDESRAEALAEAAHDNLQPA